MVNIILEKPVNSPGRKLFKTMPRNIIAELCGEVWIWLPAVSTTLYANRITLIIFVRKIPSYNTFEFSSVHT